MKIYQTTVQMVNFFPETNKIENCTFDANDDIKLTTDWSEAFLNHINIVNEYADKDIYCVTSVENKKIDNSIVTIIEWTPPTEFITKVVIETLVKEIN